MWCHLLPDVRFFLNMFLWLKIDTWEETHLIPSFMRAYASHSFISCLLGYSFGGAMCPSRSGWSAWVLQWSRNAEGPGLPRSWRVLPQKYLSVMAMALAGPGRKMADMDLEIPGIDIRWYKYVWNWEAPPNKIKRKWYRIELGGSWFPFPDNDKLIYHDICIYIYIYIMACSVWYTVLYYDMFWYIMRYYACMSMY